MTKVRHLAQYLYNANASNSSVYTYHDFCGACSQEIDGFHRVYTPEMLIAEYDTPPPGDDSPYTRQRFDREAEYLRFKLCPYCGATFDENWWVRPILENARVIDHFQNPGWHTGDSHEFRGEGPGCVEGHYLSVSGGDVLCWCGPEVEPSLTGCVIRHSAKTYTEYQAERALIADAHANDETEHWDEGYEPPESVEEFERRYAERSGLTVVVLHDAGRFGAPCDCGDNLCEGFQMTHRE